MKWISSKSLLLRLLSFLGLNSRLDQQSEEFDRHDDTEPRFARSRCKLSLMKMKTPDDKDHHLGDCREEQADQPFFNIRVNRNRLLIASKAQFDLHTCDDCAYRKPRKRRKMSRISIFTVAISPACLQFCGPSSLCLPAGSVAEWIWNWRSSPSAKTFFVASNRGCGRSIVCSGSGSTVYDRAAPR